MFRQSRDAAAAASRRSEAILATNTAIDSLKKGQVAPAIESLRSALASDPDFAEANHYMGIAQSAEQNWQEANRSFNAAVQQSPSDPSIHYNYAVSLEKQGDWNNAAREFQTVLSLRPGQVQTMCQYADALMHAGQTELAKAEWQHAKELGSCSAANP